MKELSNFFTNTILVLLLIAFFIINGLMNLGEGGIYDLWQLSGRLIPDLNFYQTDESLNKMFSDWGAQGRLYYVKYQYRDFIYPIIYSVLLTGILIRLIRPVTINFWVLIPSFAMLFDFAENYYLRVLVYDFPDFILNVKLASIFSTLKWVTILFVFILIFIAWRNRRKSYLAKKSKY